MIKKLEILDVSGEFIMDIAKVIASSPYPLSKIDVINSFSKSKVYVNRAINQCSQLELIEINDGLYYGVQKYSGLIKRSVREQLYVPFRDVLQKYPPFLLYADFLSKGYSSEESTKIVKGIFRINASEKIIEKSLKNWGKYAKLIIEEKEMLIIPDAEKGLPSEYVESLLKALQADLKASIFIVETMGSNTYAYLTEKGAGIDELTYALINYEAEPKISANRACQAFEHYLYIIAKEEGIDISLYSGIIQLVNKLKENNVILKNHTHIFNGIGGIRNMSHHDPDKETGKVWDFTPQGAIISSLAVPTAIRSLYIYLTEKKQEF